MTEKTSQEAFSLACEVFVNASVLHTAMNVSIQEYRHYMDAYFDSICSQSLSLIAIDTQTNKLVGCLIACDYSTQEYSLMSVPNRLKPVNALLKSLDNLYRKNRQIQKGQFMLVDMAAVSPIARGQGIYTKLRKAAHCVGREAGFSVVVGELSSAVAQQLCINKLNHKVCAEIMYSTFEYKGQRPFATIKSPKSIVLVEGRL